jgi:hypothetical protein
MNPILSYSRQQNPNVVKVRASSNEQIAGNILQCDQKCWYSKNEPNSRFIID